MAGLSQIAKLFIHQALLRRRTLVVQLRPASLVNPTHSKRLNEPIISLARREGSHDQ